jgi:mannose-6-phosphate isomerase-like protein (cupin superfamily)
MLEEIIQPKKGTNLRKNGQEELTILIDSNALKKKIFLINGTTFFTKDLSAYNLIVKPNDYYMVINKGDEEVNVKYSIDISSHIVIYEPYMYESFKKENFDPIRFGKKYNVPDGYIDTLAKWYSIKFTYPDYNLIFIKPKIGISIQTHKFRSERWKVLKGKPIIINGNKVHYFVENGTEFLNAKMTYHSVINPNNNPDQFVLIEEKWSGKFDEEDIIRAFNPNNYH